MTVLMTRKEASDSTCFRQIKCNPASCLRPYWQESGIILRMHSQIQWYIIRQTSFRTGLVIHDIANWGGFNHLSVISYFAMQNTLKEKIIEQLYSRGKNMFNDVWCYLFLTDAHSVTRLLIWVLFVGIPPQMVSFMW